jgi:uncharacterized protein YecE (DUF72 family)
VASPAVGTVRVGCSGWSYADWRGPVYPPDLPARRWLEEYATRFDTVELNSTHYRLPSPSTVEAWAAEAPDGFCFAVKLGRFGSHRKKLKDPEPWLANHLDRVRRLGPHLGPNLVQLPPRWHRDVPRLDDFLAAAPTDVRWAVEVRDPSWLHDDVFATLQAHGAALCLHDLLPDHPHLRTAGWTYVRFHGPDALARPYHGRYGGRRLWRWADRLGAWRDEGTDVVAYFNNDVGAAAVADAAWLRDRLAPTA